MQGLPADGFNAHPAAVDVATQLGAVFDTDPAAGAGGAVAAARVPVGLGAYSVPASASQVCTRWRHSSRTAPADCSTLPVCKICARQGAQCQLKFCTASTHDSTISRFGSVVLMSDNTESVDQYAVRHTLIWFCLQAATLHAVSDAASVSADGMRLSGFVLHHASGGAAAALAGWRARPIGRSKQLPEAGTAAAAAAEAEAAAQLAAQLEQLAAAAWVYETQWQAAAAASTGSSHAAIHASRDMRWQLQPAGKAAATYTARVAGISSLCTCLGLLRVLQHPDVGSSAATLSVFACSGTHSSSCSSSGRWRGGCGGCGGMVAAAMLRTAVLEQPRLLYRLRTSDALSHRHAPSADLDQEAELRQSAATWFVPRRVAAGIAGLQIVHSACTAAKHHQADCTSTHIRTQQNVRRSLIACE